MSIQQLACLALCLSIPFGAARANGCGMTLPGLNGDQAEFIDGIGLLRASRVKAIEQYESCDTAQNWCKTGELGPSINRFDKAGRLVFQQTSSLLGGAEFRYEGQARLPSQEVDGDYVTHFRRDADGRLLERATSGLPKILKIRWNNDGKYLVAETLPGASVFWRRAFKDGRLAWEEMDGMPMIDLGSLTVGPPSTRSRTECRYTTLPNGNLHIETLDVHGSSQSVRHEEIRDADGLTLRSWLRALDPARAAKGLGDGKVHRYSKFDEKRNWTHAEVCQTASSWDDLKDCRQIRRVLSYWAD